MTRFLYDSNVFLYALGAPSPYREPCQRIVDLAGERRLRGEASAELVQEVLHVRGRRPDRRGGAVHEARAVLRLCHIHPLEPRDLELALDLYARHDGLPARDAMHAAVALNRGIGTILSADRHFDRVPGLTRVDPADPAAVDALAH